MKRSSDLDSSGFLIVVILVLLLWAAERTQSQYRFDCEPNFCDRKENACADLYCEHGRLVKHATRCGCCDICIRILKQGEKCSTKVYGIQGELEECGAGLVCNESSKTCVPAPTKCVQNQIAFDENPTYRDLLRQRPECDYFGYYKPVACIPEVLCYCVNKQGERIFGTDLSTNNDTMKCDCSLDIEGFERPVQGDQHPRCLPSGNYDPLQCTEDMCFCMDSLSPEEDVVSVNASVKKLSCYKADVHENRMKSRCWGERAAQSSVLANDSFSAVIGLDLVACDPDGSYSPKQCQQDRCRCVSRSGKPFIGYEVRRRSKGAEDMKCDCLRDKEFLKDKGKRMKRMECDQLGNYVAIDAA